MPWEFVAGGSLVSRAPLFQQRLVRPSLPCPDVRLQVLVLLLLRVELCCRLLLKLLFGRRARGPYLPGYLCACGPKRV